MHQRLSAAILCFDYTTGKKKPPVPGAKFCPVPAGFSFGPHRGPFLLCPLLFCFRNWFSLYKLANGHGEPTESFRPPFSKGGGFQRQSLWARPAGRETLFRLIRIRRGAPTVRWTVGAWGTLSRGSPMGRTAAHFFVAPFYFAFATNSHSMKL